MRVIANETHIKTRTKVGELAPFVGLILLVGATLFVYMRPEWWIATMVMIWLGFTVSLIGSYLGDRYVGPLAPHKKVPEALKGLDNTYTLLMYKAPSPFVLVDPGGVTVFAVKPQGGEVSYRDGRWLHRQKVGMLRRLVGQERLGHPIQASEAEAKVMRRFLDKRLPDGVEVPVRSVIVFTEPKVQLEAEQSAIPALRSSELKRWLRKDGSRPKLSEEVMQQLFGIWGIDT